jgi:hypothetical protein
MFILRMPVLAGAAIYAAFQLVYAYFSLQNGPDGVAYFAHLGGLVAGILLAPILVPRRGDRPRARVDLDRFTPFARTDQAKTILEAMRKNHDEPAVFQAWLEKFLHAAQCPTCSSKVMPHGEGRLRCAQRHEFDVRQA